MYKRSASILRMLTVAGMLILVLLPRWIPGLVQAQVGRPAPPPGPGLIWTATYTLSQVQHAVSACSAAAQGGLTAEHWLNVHASGSGRWDGVRGSRYARVICLPANPPPNFAEGFTAVIIVFDSTNTGPEKVESEGAALRDTMRSLSPPGQAYTY
jgi:hypothetical protein